MTEEDKETSKYEKGSAFLFTFSIVCFVINTPLGNAFRDMLSNV
jgi:hypothetical protein